MSRQYINAKKDSPEELMAKATPIPARVLKIKKSSFSKSISVEVTPITGVYSHKLFKQKCKNIRKDVDIGTIVYLYIDDVDADGEYYIDVS